MSKTFTNTLGMQFVLAPRGTFWMGPPDRQWHADIPHNFFMGIHPATQGQWQTFMGSNRSRFSPTGAKADRVKEFSADALASFPVEMVSWHEVQEFIQNLNARESNREWTYRLPTEVEWEYACRAGATSQHDCSFDFYFRQPTNDATSQDAN